VAHHSRLAKVVVGVPGDVHDQELTFWQEALGVKLIRSEDSPQYHGAQVPHQDVEFLLQRLGAGPARVHLDIHTDDLDAEIARLERLGARRVRKAGDLWIMQDPAGLLFCVIPHGPDETHAGNAHRWD
jgi:hypothetical protein